MFTFDDSHLIIIMEWRSFSVLHCLLYGLSVADEGRTPTVNNIFTRLISTASRVTHKRAIRKNKNKATTI